MTELAAAKIAQERRQRPGEGFRRSQMVTDHTKTSEELKSMAPADAKAAIPTALDSSSQSKIDKLKNARGRRISPPITKLPCKSVPTRMRYRCSSAMRRAATIRS